MKKTKPKTLAEIRDIITKTPGWEDAKITCERCWCDECKGKYWRAMLFQSPVRIVGHSTTESGALALLHVLWSAKWLGRTCRVVEEVMA